jgi:hypothetical protein
LFARLVSNRNLWRDCDADWLEDDMGGSDLEIGGKLVSVFNLTRIPDGVGGVEAYIILLSKVIDVV